MKTELDCVPCFVRQSLKAARLASSDPHLQEELVREMLPWIAEMDFSQSPPVFAQQVYRHLRELTGVADPYARVKIHLNHMATRVISGFKQRIDDADDPLLIAVKLAIAGNVIDLGPHDEVPENEVRLSVKRVLEQPLGGDFERFRQTVDSAQRILYLADNAGEIVFDRLLIEALDPKRVTVAVRGHAVLNDATLADAGAAGLPGICRVIDNGSDAPGTLLDDCNLAFRQRFMESDLIIAKGQGNFESLSDDAGNIFFLFKVKCPVVATHAKLPVHTHALLHSSP